MRQLARFVGNNKFFIFLFILCCFSYSHFFVNRALVELTIDVETKTPFQIFWAKGDQGYSIYRMAEIYLRPNIKKYRFYATNLRNADKLRIDTHIYQGKVVIHELNLKQTGLSDIQFKTKDDFAALSPLNQVESISATNSGATIISTGNDPMVELKLEKQSSTVNPLHYVIGFLVIGLFLWLIIHNLGHLNKELQFVPYFLAVALTFALVIACTTVDGYHPDEEAHVTATSYYKDHWVPPVVEDESIRYTYSVYGASRLNYGEAYYLLAGKFVKALDVFQMKGYLPYRLFNVFLFSIIFLYCVKTPQARLLAIPFLISPQLWYAFSYCTSDAFALLIVYLVGCQLFVPTSMLQKMIVEKISINQLLRYLCVGLLFSALLLIKKNFYPFCVAVFVIFLVNLFKNTSSFERKRVFTRLVLLLSTIFFFYGVHKAVDISVNGLDKKERMHTLAEQIALPRFNLSSPLSDRSPLFNLQERGETVKGLLVKYKWFERTFRSSFGVYGHSSIMAQDGFYNVVRVCSVALFLFFFGSILIRAPWINKIESLALLSFCIALIAASIQHSYTMEVQPQGRYLFPIFGILALIYARNYKFLNSRFFTLFVTLLFLLAVHSYIFEAIYRIPR